MEIIADTLFQRATSSQNVGAYIQVPTFYTATRALPAAKSPSAVPRKSAVVATLLDALRSIPRRVTG